MKFTLLSCSLILIALSCKKSDGGGTPGPIDTSLVAPAIDPPTAQTIGFFLDDWQERKFTKPTQTIAGVPPRSADLTVTVDRSNIITKIPRSYASANSNLWMGQFVTEPGLLGHITALHPHIIRFPGGSISDVFFWNAQPGAPPADAPAQLVQADGTSATAGYWYGKNTQEWTFSVDNFYSMLQQTGNKGMITINYAYARYGTGKDPVANAAHLAADWVRYDKGRTMYWEIGNENFGSWEASYRINKATNQDGQPEYQSGQLYGQHFKVFADSMHKAAAETGATIKIGAVMSEGPAQPWWDNTARTWNDGMLPTAGNVPDFYIVHNYFTDFNANSTASTILDSPIPISFNMMYFVQEQIKAAGVPVKPVILGEWNIFATGSMQAVSHINGLHAVMVLGESIKNNYGLTARWDLANGWNNGNDMGMFSNGDEPGVSKWEPRPAFHAMFRFQQWLGDRMVVSGSTDRNIVSYASSFSSGETSVAIVNRSVDSKNVNLAIKNFHKGSNFYWYTLTGGTDNGEFSRKTFVNGTGPASVAGGPANYKTLAPYYAPTANGVNVTVPGMSVVFVVVERN